MQCFWEDLSATVSPQARAGESLDSTGSPARKATSVTSGAQQHGQVPSTKAGLAAQLLASVQGLGARCVQAVNSLDLLLCSLTRARTGVYLIFQS